MDSKTFDLIGVTAVLILFITVMVMFQFQTIEREADIAEKQSRKEIGSALAAFVVLNNNFEGSEYGEVRGSEVGKLQDGESVKSISRDLGYKLNIHRAEDSRKADLRGSQIIFPVYVETDTKIQSDYNIVGIGPE